MAGLRDHLPDEVLHPVDFALLPRRFQTSGVSEAAGRKSGIGELPYKPVHDQNRK
jgi:hypothetical protein